MIEVFLVLFDGIELTIESDFDEAIFQLGLGYHRLGNVEKARACIFREDPLVADKK